MEGRDETGKPAAIFPSGDATSIRVISDADKIRGQYLGLIKSATSEILLIFPTINSIYREKSIGVLDELKNAVGRGVKTRLLSAEDDFIEGPLHDLRDSGVVVMRIETPTETKFKLLIVDRTACLVVETKDDTKAKFNEAIGQATFTSSKATILPYVTIFESFWRETELYERARESDKLKDEFVNIAAHELKTPITPIISGAELMRETLMSVREKLDARLYDSLVDDSNLILRNASKLQKLSEDILQASRLEGGTFKLNLETVDIDQLVTSAIKDVERRYLGERPDVKMVYESVDRSQSNPRAGGDQKTRRKLEISCDPQKVSQVLINILDNAMKFTRQGQVRVTSAVDSWTGEVLISIRDSGSGISPSIKPKLFEKFAANSVGGTGLGLYISKKIIDAHGGRIWATNNVEDTGSTFYFSLPMFDEQGPENSLSTSKEGPVGIGNRQT